METVVFCGIPGAGKSTLYLERFFDTHLRINLDMLRTRRRERLVLRACLAAGQRFVVDNTNALPAERAAYVQVARAARFRTVCYFFDVSLDEALERNRARAGRARVPDAGVRAMAARLVVPSHLEGFDALFRVQVLPEGGFAVDLWDGL